MRSLTFLYFVFISSYFNAPVPTFALEDQCTPIGRIAEAIMKRRQDGLSLQSTLDAIDKAKSSTTSEIYKKMIMNAYDVPLYGTQKNKDRAIGEFRDSEQLACMKILHQP